MRTLALSLSALAASAALLLAPSAASARDRVVSPKGGRHYARITDALYAARPGDRVVVRPGVYDECLTLSTERVHLRGAGADRTVVRCSGGEPALSVTEVRAGTVEGLGFHLVDAPSQFAVSLRDTRITLRAVHATGSALSGIGVSGGAPRIEDSSAFGNDEAGLAAFDASSVEVVGGLYFGNALGGISLASESRGTVRGAVVRDNIGDGVAGIERASLQVLDCLVCGNRSSGINASGSALEARRNVVCENEFAGIAVLDEGATGTVEGNVVWGNGTYGITFERGGSGAARHNTVVDNQGSGLNAIRDSAPRFEDNLVVGHTAAEWSAGIDAAFDEGEGRPVVGRNGTWDNRVDVSGPVADAALVRADPRFRDRAGRDLRLGRGSPARGAASDGRDLGAPPEVLDPKRITRMRGRD